MRSFALSGLLAMVLLARAHGQYRDRAVNPKDYVSPSGRYELWVNPDDSDASKGAKYRLTFDGKVLWEKRFPFALIRAGITDEGRFGGYAIRSSGANEGEIVVAVGSSNGQIVLADVHKRHPTQIVDGSPTPYVPGLIFDPEHDRMIVRADDPKENNGREQWWTYRLSDGTLGRPLDPEKYMGAKNVRLIDGRALSGTPLILLTWMSVGTKRGAILTLVDDNAKPVWRLDLRDDLEVGKNEFERAEAETEFEPSGSILSVTRQQFEIRLLRKRQAVSYSVTPNNGGWSIKEVGTRPYVLEAAHKIRNPNVPVVSLELLRKWRIPRSDGKESPIDIDEFEIVGGKWLAVLSGGERPALVVMDQNGRSPRTIPLAKEKLVGGANCLAWLGGSRFLVTKLTSYRPSRTAAWIINVVTRKVTPVSIARGNGVEAAAGFGDGGFVTIETEDHAYSSNTGLVVYDRNGRVTWEGPRGGGYSGADSELLSPEDVAVDTKGRIVVLEVTRHRLQRYSRTGKFLSYVDLDKVWKVKAEYPARFRCVGSGFLLWDMSVAYRLDSKGKIVEKILPRLANFKPVDSRFDPQLDSQGRVWISDGNSLYRLGKTGVVQAWLGKSGFPSGLHSIDSVLVKPDGSVYAMDGNSG